MLVLLLGVATFWLAHLLPRLAPERRAAMGSRGRIVISLALTVSMVLMVLGYRSAEGRVWWGRSPAGVGINNLLIVFAFYLFAAAGMKTRITRILRHPQLIGFALWAVAHLLVNGDLPSIVLFGGLLLWAITEIIVLNRATHWLKPFGPFPIRKEIIAVAAALLVTGAVAGLHTLAGVRPFGG